MILLPSSSSVQLINWLSHCKLTFFYIFMHRIYGKKYKKIISMKNVIDFYGNKYY